ncbi:MAG: AAA family ATPase [Nitrospirota bacterium]
MSDRRPIPPESRSPRSSASDESLLGLIDRCLASLPENDPKQKWLYRIRHLVLQDERARRDAETESQKLKGVVEKLTAPANRIGIVVGVPGADVVRVVVGGAEYWAGVDPRLACGDIKIGVQVLVNEAFAVIKVLGYESGGPALRVVDALADGRIRIGQEAGGQSSFVIRSADLVGVEIHAGDEVRVDSSHRVAIERLETKGSRDRVLDETPDVTWEQIGGQREAIAAIRKSIEAPLLHADTFARFQFSPPKGFLLFGPPGCGKTMIGKATAASLAASLAAGAQGEQGENEKVRGAFLHVKGPEILNMWLGESERLVRDLFAQARARRKAGLLPVIFIDEAESILGTRRSVRALNIANTLVPMFCAEMDGVSSLRDVVIILASNRPDLIDPAILRPGRIDRKIKVTRPGREDAAEIFKLHLGTVPVDPTLVKEHGDEATARTALATVATDQVFGRSAANRVLAVRLRSGLRETLYRGDVVSGAILAAIVQRAKERAIERAVGGDQTAGVGVEDLTAAIDAEFSQGEILPPDDTADEWLKLLDHDPQHVVGVSSFRAGREGAERPVHVIV